MKQNKYDDTKFFNEYKQMARSVYGLKAAGEWHELRKMLPNFEGKSVLDLGCGFGWHCKYAAEQGAKKVIGIDLSEKMLQQAREVNNSEVIQYVKMPIEEIEYTVETFEVVISSLALHYVENFEEVCRKVHRCLVVGGEFVFSVEHPIFTAQGRQDWIYDEKGNRLYWPVDKYFTEGKREAQFLGEEIVKYHKTLTTYINSLVKSGFEIIKLVEPMPELSMLEGNQEMQDELRRPMMLLIEAKKK